MPEDISNAKDLSKAAGNNSSAKGPPQKDGPKSWIGETVDQLGRIFRHMLPGLSLLLMAHFSRPSWFCWVDYRDRGHLVVLGTVALVAGNMLYVLHRYSVHQLCDRINYWVWSHKKERCDYLDWVVGHVHKSFHWVDDDSRLRDHINLRSAQIIFLFITGEIALLFSAIAEAESFFSTHRGSVGTIALAVILVAAWQQYVGFRLDVHLTGENRSALVSIAGSAGSKEKKVKTDPKEPKS
jgi:hypothetical protein